MMKRVYIIKKILFLSFLILLVFILVGCETDLPPEPGSPGPIGGAAAIYEGYGPSHDVFNNDEPIYSISKDKFFIAPPKDTFDFDSDVQHQGAFIYKFGYFWANDVWNRYTFPQATVEGSNWIQDSTSIPLTVNSDEVPDGENYVVAYSCKKYNRVWKCGCSTIDGPCNQWMLQTYEITKLPPEPLPPRFSSGQVSNSKGNFQYNEYLDIFTGASPSKEVLESTLGHNIARYLLEFKTPFVSDVDDQSGAASATGTYLTDFEDVELSILGKGYTIVNANRLNSAGNNIVLILMGGPIVETLLEGDTKTYTLDGTSYEVTLDFVDSDSAKFTVNGVATRNLLEGETDIAGGTTIGVTDILYQDYTGGVHQATFILGAYKLELKDTDITDTISTNTLVIDGNSIADENVIIEGTDDSTTFRINKIRIEMP